MERSNQDLDPGASSLPQRGLDAHLGADLVSKPPVVFPRGIYTPMLQIE
jgi:hypothetical protein